jgi:hypothetical protein
MNYQEFKKEYKYSCKHWPDVTAVYDNERFAPRVVTTNQEKHGSRWITTSEDVKVINWEHYMNIIDAVPFFRGLGGTERVETNYTLWGKLPDKITSTSPDRESRTIREFIF